MFLQSKTQNINSVIHSDAPIQQLTLSDIFTLVVGNQSHKSLTCGSRADTLRKLSLCINYPSPLHGTPGSFAFSRQYPWHPSYLTLVANDKTVPIRLILAGSVQISSERSSDIWIY